MVNVEHEGLAPGVEPLSPAERAWLKSLEKVLKAQPRRLMLVECSDSIFVVDRQASLGVDLQNGKARANGLVLADVQHSFGKLTGVSG